MPLVLRGAESCPQSGTDQDLLDAAYRGLELDGDRRADAAMLAELQKRFNTAMPRKRESMVLVAAGRFNKRIAAALDLSEITVKVYYAQVMRKMEAKLLPDLVHYADRVGLGTTKP